MAYEVYFFRFANADLLPIDPSAVRAALLRHGVQLDGDSQYTELSDGAGVEIWASNLSAGELTDIGFVFRGVSGQLYELIFDLMVAADLTALVVENPSIPLVLSEEVERHLPDADFAPAVVCRSSSDVRSAIEPGFNSWADWAGF